MAHIQRVKHPSKELVSQLKRVKSNKRQRVRKNIILNTLRSGGSFKAITGGLTRAVRRTRRAKGRDGGR